MISKRYENIIWYDEYKKAFNHLIKMRKRCKFVRIERIINKHMRYLIDSHPLYDMLFCKEYLFGIIE